MNGKEEKYNIKKILYSNAMVPDYGNYAFITPLLGTVLNMA